MNDKALEVLHQSLHYSFDAKDTAIAYINIGYIYGMRNMQDSAITYQRKAVKYAMRSKDRSMILTSWHNLSICYRHFENVDSAVVYAYKVYSIYLMGMEKQMLIIIWGIYMLIWNNMIQHAII